MNICKNELSQINFEGGFIAGKNPPEEKYREFILNKKIRLTTYLKKTQESLFVFNVPAVHGCHGWKLPEYLALGKAIISTPLINQLPFPLKHGENIHFVKSEEELKEGILKIAEDQQYRERLSSGAKAYFNHYLEPKEVIAHFLSKID